MTQQVQPGAKVDAEVYSRFREHVKRNRGSIRGNLGDELERAMIDRMDAVNGPDSLERIENDVATIKAMLADSGTDGGTPAPTPSEPNSTHTRDSDKPGHNQPREKKVDYLINELFDRQCCSYSRGELPESKIREIIQEEYGFDDSTVDDYVSLILRELDAEENPRHGASYVWGERYDEAIDRLREEASNKMDSIE